jgi:hypothetical protein
MAEGKKTTIDPGIITRVGQGLKYAFTGRAPEAWFGPGEPQAPAAPEEVKGRQWDYPAGYNLRMQPRGEESISFGQLRSLALNCDLVRLAIETRKDQLCKLSWNIKATEAAAAGGKRLLAAAKAQAGQAKDLFKKPDRVHRWNQWLRMWMEDMFVGDCATLYPRKDRGGGLYALEVMDGALIKPVLDDSGRTPLPPLPAYQQILKGVPAANYTLDELIYFPRNPLSWRVYGLSPVEQIIITVNIVIRRQIHLLQYYTEGNLPDSLLEVPEAWSTEQIREWQQYWDSLFAGNTAQRRKGTWVPNGMTPHSMKEAALKDAIDEWFARVVCFCFSLSPQAFVQQMNRATAETAEQASLEEGLAPLQEWIKDGIDEGLERGGFDLVEFAWEEESTTKPKEQAEIDEIHLRSGVRRRSEIRQDRGYEKDRVPDFLMTVAGPVLLDEIGKAPLAPEGSPAGAPAPPNTNGEPGTLGPGDGESVKETAGPTPLPAQKLAKVAEGKKNLQPLDRERPEVVKARAALQKLMLAALKADAAAAAAQLAQALGLEKVAGGDARPTGLAKAEEDQAAKIDRLLQELTLAGISATREEAAAILAKAAQNGGWAAFTQIGLRTAGEDAHPTAIVNQVNKLAVEWAENRAAELVTKISEATRDYLRADVTQAVEEGWSTRQLGQALQENYGFSEGRGEMIARTEIAQADVQGNLMAYRNSGVVQGKEWIRGSEEYPCDECEGNAAAGVIPLEDAFPSGDTGPPAHPNCVCDVLPVVAEQGDGA